MYRAFFLIWLFYGGSLITFAQTPPEVKALVDSARQYYYKDGQKTLAFSRKAFRLSEEANNYWGKLNALQLIGEGYFTLGKLDSAMHQFEQAMVLAKKENDGAEIANNYISFASIKTEMGDYNEAIDFYQLGIEKQVEIGDSSGMCDAWLRKGNVYSSQGNHPKATEAYLTSLRICEAAGRKQMVGYNYGSLAIIHDKRDEYAKAEEYYDKALDVFKSISDDYAVASVLNNKGIMYKNIGSYQKAIDAYEESLALFTKIGVARGRNACLTNLGILHNELGQYELGTSYSLQGLALARELNNQESEQDNLNALARSSLGLGDDNRALRYAGESKVLADDLGSLEKMRDVEETYSMIYRKTGQYERALDHYERFVTYKDSVVNLEQSRQVNELTMIYETEKKDSEIRILEKNAEIDRIRKTGLGIGLTLSLIAGILLVFQQVQKRRKDKQIFSQQQEIEIQKRKNAELENERLNTELAFKQKELTAKVLQLARKNEFLQDLQQRVNVIRNNAVGKTQSEVRRLERTISRDVESETDWDDFLSSFKEVHKDFTSDFVKQYDGLSKNDLKLACLMKMNLDSNKIAQLLNITTDGVKKARYRLRKKMELESDVNIQEYLIAFPDRTGA